MTIKESRTRLGLTQAQLAEKLNVSVRTVQSWEMTNPKQPNRWLMRDIAELFQDQYRCEHCGAGICQSKCINKEK